MTTCPDQRVTCQSLSAGGSDRSEVSRGSSCYALAGVGSETRRRCPQRPTASRSCPHLTGLDRVRARHNNFCSSVLYTAGVKSSRQQSSVQRSGKTGSLRRFAAPLVALLVVLLFIVIAQLSERPAVQGNGSSAEVAFEDRELPIVKREESDPAAIGSVSAPVVLVTFTDLRCPYCAIFSRNTLPDIVREYVDAGKVRIEVHDVAFFGQQSEDAAVAARAAGNQQKYLAFVEAVFAAAPDRGHPELPRERLIAFAEEAGVPDMDRFVADLDDPELRMAAQASTVQAQQFGVNSVPFFVAGASALSGAQPADAFRSFLDTALAEVG